MLNTVILKKSLCALANAGSGVLIIGAKDNLIQGFPYVHSEREDLMNNIVDIQKNIFPNTYIIPQLVCVEKNIFDSDFRISKNLYVWRILILPFERNKVHYYTVKKTGFMPLTEVFTFSSENKIEKMESTKDKRTKNDGEDDGLYNIFMRKRFEFKKNIYINSHY